MLTGQLSGKCTITVKLHITVHPDGYVLSARHTVCVLRLKHRNGSAHGVSHTPKGS